MKTCRKGRQHMGENLVHEYTADWRTLRQAEDLTMVTQGTWGAGELEAGMEINPSGMTWYGSCPAQAVGRLAPIVVLDGSRPRDWWQNRRAKKRPS